MDLTHRFRVPASVEETWTAFNHLDRLAPCFPGAAIERSRGDHFEGSMKVKIGPVALLYSGSGRFLERDAAARRVVFQASGADRRGNGTATATVTASLAGDGSATDVELRTDLDVTGRPAQFGSGVIADIGTKLLEQFVSCVSGRFADGGLAAPAATDETGAGAPEADDELWEDWATTENQAEVGGPSDERPTVEMAAVGAVGADPTAGRGGSTAIGTRAASAEDRRPEPEPVRTASAPPPPYRYTPPSNLSRADAHVAYNVAATLLRRYGPLLGFVSLLVVLVIELVNRRRR